MGCQIVLVPNCPLLLSWCQIVRFYYFGAKLSSAKLSGAKLSYNQNQVPNFCFNCKNGKVSPILRLHPITRVRITPKLNFCPKFAKNDLLSSIIISNVWCQIVLVPHCPV